MYCRLADSVAGPADMGDFGRSIFRHDADVVGRLVVLKAHEPDMPVTPADSQELA